MANRLNRLDLDLQTCYKHDLDWSLLPEKLREVCTENICFLPLVRCLVGAISFVVSALNNTCDSGHYVITLAWLVLRCHCPAFDFLNMT